jgi:hypothetical protein
MASTACVAINHLFLQPRACTWTVSRSIVRACESEWLPDSLRPVATTVEASHGHLSVATLHSRQREEQTGRQERAWVRGSSLRLGPVPCVVQKAAAHCRMRTVPVAYSAKF